VNEPFFGDGWRPYGRASTAALVPGSTNAESGSSHPAERVAGSVLTVDVAATGLAGSAIETALNCAGSIDRAVLGGREPAGSGTATRAEAAMMAANATMILGRTIDPRGYPDTAIAATRGNPREGRNGRLARVTSSAARDRTGVVAAT
jgi:hypothetical protein